MAFTRVKGATATQFGASTVTATFGSAVAIGNTVVVGISMAGGASVVNTIADDKGNVYSLARAIVGSKTWQYYSIITISGATAITVTSNANGGITLACEEYAGGATADIVGASSEGSGNSLASSVAAFTPTAGNLVVATVRSLNDNLSAGAGYTMGSGAGGIGVGNEYILSCAASETAPGVLTNFQGTGDNWTEVAVEYSLTPLSRQAAFREKYSQLLAHG